MDIKDVPEFCNRHCIDWKEVDETDEHGKGFYFHWNNPKDPEDGECCHMIPEAVEKLSPQKFYQAVVSGRDVIHMTRVVGYYSRVENWNPSKKGELKDRQKGNYTVEEPKGEGETA